MVKRVSFIAVFVFAFASVGFSQVLTARASTDTTAYQVGDYIHYWIQVIYNKGTTVQPPVIADSLKTLSLIRTEKPVTTVKGNTVVTTYNYIISGYDSAGVTVPPIPVSYRLPGRKSLQSVATNPVSFTISTLKVDLQGNIKDVKSPLTIPLNWLWILLWVVLALLLIGVLFYLYRRRKRKAAKPQPAAKAAALPPDVVALNSLRELEKKQLWQNGRIKEYHSEITEIIRRYFEGRFAMPAMELPTSEALELLRRSHGSEQVIETTSDFLSNADMVKFAKYTPLGSVNEEMMRQAYEIVNKSRRDRGPEEEEKAATSDVQ